MPGKQTGSNPVQFSSDRAVASVFKKAKNAKRRVLTIALAGLLLLTLALYIELAYGWSAYPKRIYATQANLMQLSQDVRLFNEKVGRWPSSLSELRDYEGLPEKGRAYREYISTEDGVSTESTRLDGSGGWYYDRTSGQVRVNLNRPVQNYLRFTILRRGQRPCDWQAPDEE